MNAKQSKRQAILDPEMEVSQALSAILAHHLALMISWEDKARSWENIEGVHQMRVHSRQLRAALSAFRAAVPKSVSQPWRDELGWVASQLGAARDLDVLIDEFLASVCDKLPLNGADTVRARAEVKRALAYEQVNTMLDSQRYAEFKQGFRVWIDQRLWEEAALDDKHRTTLKRALAPYARRLIKRLKQRTIQAGTGVDTRDPEQMHWLRIQCKKLRYAAEFFTPVDPELDELIAYLKGLQTLLGELNDAVVMRGLLNGLLEGTSDPDLLRYTGALIGWRAYHGEALLSDFGAYWRAFAAHI
ncbi:CHAD domain-containing protein [Caldichromatium japonicum]|uniref:CHAD domain-containing protein n=1 Tax=Caldichromatium japonicum TaxID=2699430 RepID=A0A6G7VG16_9GAMM|nr:CHAD domain-containing protein [Caldichromatium japonicum]QIK38788.1 CHAD domain-containing protein [Caldichromatium japonicum]